MHTKLEDQIDEIKTLTVEELAEMFNCKSKEICMGDYIASRTDDLACPYKVIMGFANFEGSNVERLGKLEIVFGRKFTDSHGPILDVNHNAIYLGLNLKNSKITNLGNLKKCYGTIILNSNLTDLVKLEVIEGILCLEDDENKCGITSLGKLKKVRRLYINSNSLRDLGDLEEVNNVRMFSKCKDEVNKLIENNLTCYGNKYYRVYNEVKTQD